MAPRTLYVTRSRRAGTRSGTGSLRGVNLSGGIGTLTLAGLDGRARMTTSARIPCHGHRPKIAQLLVVLVVRRTPQSNTGLRPRLQKRRELRAPVAWRLPGMEQPYFVGRTPLGGRALLSILPELRRAPLPTQDSASKRSRGCHTQRLGESPPAGAVLRRRPGRIAPCSQARQAARALR